MPFAFYRSGTSRGIFLAEADLPAGAERDATICSLMGSGHPQQLEGFGGGSGVTSKVAVVGLREDGSLTYSFAQCRVNEASVDRSHGDCGNMIAAVAPFALERQLVRVQPHASSTSIRIHSQSTGAIYEAVVQMNPSGGVMYDGTACVPGVPRPAAPVGLTTHGVAGSQTGTLLPTGNAVDQLQLYPLGTEPYSEEVRWRREEGFESYTPARHLYLNATLIDFARALVIVNGEEVLELLRTMDPQMHALRVRHSPDEIPLLPAHLAGCTKEKMEADKTLCNVLESARRAGSMLLGMGDCTGKDSPKIAIVASAPPLQTAAFEVAGDDSSPPKRRRFAAGSEQRVESRIHPSQMEDEGGDPAGAVASLAARYWVNPARCEMHPTVAMTAAQALGAACLVEGSIAARALPNGARELRRSPSTGLYSFEVVHATGRFPVEIGVSETQQADTRAPTKLPHGTPTHARYVTTVRPIAEGRAFVQAEPSGPAQVTSGEASSAASAPPKDATRPDGDTVQPAKQSKSAAAPRFTLDWSQAKNCAAQPEANASAVTLIGPAFGLTGEQWLQDVPELLWIAVGVLRSCGFECKVMPGLDDLEPAERNKLRRKPPHEQEKSWLVKHVYDQQIRATLKSLSRDDAIVVTLNAHGAGPAWLQMHCSGFLQDPEACWPTVGLPGMRGLASISDQTGCRTWRELQAKLTAALRAQNVHVAIVRHCAADVADEFDYSIASAGLAAPYSLHCVTGGSGDGLGRGLASRFSLRREGTEVARALCAYRNVGHVETLNEEANCGGPALEMIEVASEWRGRGLGKALLLSVEGMLRSRFMQCFTETDEGARLGLRMTTRPVGSNTFDAFLKWLAQMGYDDDELEELCGSVEQGEFGVDVVEVANMDLVVGKSKNILFPRVVRGGPSVG